MRSATLTSTRRLYLVGASGRCAECGRVISQGRAIWSIEQYHAPICEMCAIALYGSDDGIPCRVCDGTGHVQYSGCGERPERDRMWRERGDLRSVQDAGRAR